ncbi:MAG: hypothetical protein JZU65_11310 [Chlorobium sp.]|nr:hypothetical protein [Chlorobium sp.]
MKNNKPIKLQTDPEYKRPNAKSYKSSRAKKPPRKENLRVAIMHASFQARNPRTNRIYTVFMALCAKAQKPWKNRNFGSRIDKDTFRNQLTNLDILG